MREGSVCFEGGGGRSVCGEGQALAAMQSPNVGTANADVGREDVGKAIAAIKSPNGRTANKDGKHKQKQRKTAEIDKKRR